MMKHNQLSKLLSIIALFTGLPLMASVPAAQNINAVNQGSNISLGDRPAAMQEAVDQTFKRLNDRAEKGNLKWGCGGNRGFYNLMQFSDAKVIRDVIARAGNKKDIYLLDVGAGAGGWGNAAVQLLKEEFYADATKHFHVISVTGANEMESSTVQEGNITHYKMAKFKIENITTELEAHGLKLKDKVDLIVSNWTLCHLIDPVGTFKKLYQLLAPSHGTLMATGFNFCIDNRTKDKYGLATPFYNGETCALLSYLPAKILFRTYTKKTDLDEFILIRKDERPFNLPIDYQRASEETSSFKSDLYLKGEPAFCRDLGWQAGNIYYGNRKSKKFFEELTNRGLIKNPAEEARLLKRAIIDKHLEKAYRLNPLTILKKAAAKFKDLNGGQVADIAGPIVAKFLGNRKSA